MRRHAKASSAGSKLRKPSGHGASPPSGRLRLTILLATVAAFMLVPAAQAFAENTLTVNIAGSGGGEVSSVGGTYGKWGAPGQFEGEPPIECFGPPAEGTCVDEMLNKKEGEESLFWECCEIRAVGLHAFADPGSEFAGWTVEEGHDFGNIAFPEECVSEPICIMYGVAGGNAKVKATFTKELGFLLTVKKIGSGEGTVVSNPAGIECGATCAKSFEGLVTLTANPAAGSVFTSWSKCVKTIEGTGAKGHTCTVNVTAAMTVEAKFTAVKAITASKKSGSTGQGTVTSSPGGISCGPACTSATAVFTEGQSVLLKATPIASTSEFSPATGWTGCDEVITEGINAGKCKVVASAAKSVEAEFTAIPQNTLSFEKAGGGTGTVSSAPAGISCGPTCTATSASYQKTKTVVLNAVAATGSAFVKWTGCDSEPAGKCSVTMSGGKAVTAEFK